MKYTINDFNIGDELWFYDFPESDSIVSNISLKKGTIISFTKTDIQDFIWLKEGHGIDLSCIDVFKTKYEAMSTMIGHLLNEIKKYVSVDDDNR